MSKERMSKEDFKKLYLDKLPSRFQIGDEVTLNFNQAGVVYNAQVIKVHFTESKVLYDIEILTKLSDPKGSLWDKDGNPREDVDEDNLSGEVTRIYNVDSFFVIPSEEEPKES